MVSFHVHAPSREGRPRVLARVRKICLVWPEPNVAINWGRPHFLAGKRLFACVDRQHERPGVSYLRVGDRLVANPRMLSAMDGNAHLLTRKAR